LTEIGNQSFSSLLKDINILTANGGNISLYGSNLDGVLLPLFGKIFSPKLYPVTEYYLENGCATVYIINKILFLPERTAYRYNRKLANLHFIEQVSEVPKTGKMKRNAIIWGIEDCTPKESENAIKLHLRLMMPVRIQYERIAKSIFHPDLETIEYNKILEKVKESPFVDPKNVPRVADYICKFLHEKGVTVWK
jgi:hypothetical protein